MRCTLATAVSFFAAAVAAAQGPLSWSGEFGSGEISGIVRTLVTRDTPTGQHVYAGGRFTLAGNTEAANAAEWDGQRWNALGDGLGGSLTGSGTTVYAMAIFDDGSGPSLYAGGDFTTAGSKPARGIARWDGQTWSSVGGGVNDVVRALRVFDDGSGPALFVAGWFSRAGAVPAGGIAKWNGDHWDALGGGAPLGSVGYALEVYDDGSGPAFYLGGQFTHISGVAAPSLARWDGGQWTPVGGGTDGFVLTLAAIDIGQGTHLYAGGNFSTAGGASAIRIARWDGAMWSPLGQGFSAQFVTSIAAFGQGPSRSLYAGLPGAAPVLFRWTGASWVNASDGLNYTVRCLAVHDAADGPVLLAGGEMSLSSPQFPPFTGVARWRGGPAWRHGMSDLAITDGPVLKLAAADDGQTLLAAGAFTTIAGLPSPALARHTAAGWSAMGFNPGDTVSDFTWLEQGGSPVLHAAGAFPRFGNPAEVQRRVARRDGAAWTFLPQGGGAPIAAFPLRPGSTLFATVPQDPTVVRFSGGWTDGVYFGGSIPSISRMAVLDRGEGPMLFVAGRFSYVNSMSAPNIAAWDGNLWWDIGGVTAGEGVPVRDLAIFDDGAGPALYITGGFTAAGGVQANYIAKWGPSGWSPLGPGLSRPGNALAVFDDGSGPALYVGGVFTSAGGTPAQSLARWNGSAWSAVAGGVQGLVQSLAATTDPTGRSLWVAGEFTHAGGINSTRIARLVATPPVCYPNCDGSTTAPILNISDFICFLNRYAAADPYANCDGSTTPPTLGVSDFICFLNRYAAGCP